MSFLRAIHFTFCQILNVFSQDFSYYILVSGARYVRAFRPTALPLGALLFWDLLKTELLVELSWLMRSYSSRLSSLYVFACGGVLRHDTSEYLENLTDFSEFIATFLCLEINCPARAKKKNECKMNGMLFWIYWQVSLKGTTRRSQLLPSTGKASRIGFSCHVSFPPRPTCIWQMFLILPT